MASTWLLGGCARHMSSDVYSADSVGQPAACYAGVVMGAREVTVVDSDYLEGNGLGLFGGGAAGAIVGSQVGGGKGNALATLGGAIAGAVTGACAEKALKEQKGIEYIIALESGEARTIVQAPEPALAIGEKIWLMVNRNGRSRIVARTLPEIETKKTVPEAGIEPTTYALRVRRSTI